MEKIRNVESKEKTLKKSPYLTRATINTLIYFFDLSLRLEIEEIRL